MEAADDEVYRPRFAVRPPQFDVRALSRLEGAWNGFWIAASALG